MIVAVGHTRWFFDGGECRELRGTVAGDAKEYEKCSVLIEAVAKAGKNATT
ncbi:hypothetical protein [Bradyrhizobium sp. WSM471]|uniref:hypothetical protein n=1 Tax=Bradyrhizobium sp. WSM471 TaxID=319017 RepID=UPI00030E381B|nr:MULTISPECIES: hypothetical protein [Bradyrhizobium]UFW43447.1 hypothetical protein BcanWSM471_10340 [Bradyrhizobium canariense]